MTVGHRRIESTRPAIRRMLPSMPETLRATSRSAKALWNVVLGFALLAAAVPAPLSCCAGLAKPHGECCEAHWDAAARGCCDGGDSVERVVPAASQPAPAAGLLTPGRPVTPGRGILLASLPGRAPAADPTPLYALHRALLL